MTRPIVIEIIWETGPEASEGAAFAFDLQARCKRDGLPVDVLHTRFPRQHLDSLGIDTTPAVRVEGVLWFQGSLPTELGLQEIFARFLGRCDQEFEGHVDARPLPIDMQSAAKRLLEIAGPEAEARLCDLPAGEAVRTVGGEALDRLRDECRMVANDLLWEHCNSIGPLAPDWAVLEAARTLALLRRDGPDSGHAAGWKRLRVMDRIGYHRLVRRRQDGDPARLREELQEFDSPTDAWWLVNLGVELAATSLVQAGMVIVERAMTLAEATPYRIAMVQALLQKRDVGGALDYLKGLSPREVTL